MTPADHHNIGRLVIFVVPLLIILGLAIPPIVTWIYGEEVILMATAEQRELDDSFVLLDYSIESVPESLISNSLHELMATEETRQPIKVFGKLAKQDDVHVLTELTDSKPDHEPFLTGKLVSSSKNKNAYSVDFGLSRFHLLESKEETTIGPWIARVNIKSGYGIVKEIVSSHDMD